MFAVDGNFTAVHDRQKRPEDDVFLTDGTSFMTQRDPYQQHLKVALETYEVRTQLGAYYEVILKALREVCATNFGPGRM